MTDPTPTKSALAAYQQKIYTAVREGSEKADTPSTRDPRRAGTKAAILARLRDKWSLYARSAEPGNSQWRQNATRAQLLKEIIAEIEAMEDV